MWVRARRKNNQPRWRVPFFPAPEVAQRLAAPDRAARSPPVVIEQLQQAGAKIIYLGFAEKR